MEAGNEIHIAAAVILDKVGRMLVVRKEGTSAFMQPGGKFEGEEAAKDCLARELIEELNIVVSPEKMIDFGYADADAANEPNMRVVANLFLIEDIEEPKASAEIAEIKWWNLDQPTSLELAPLTIEEIRPRALSYLRGKSTHIEAAN